MSVLYNSLCVTHSRRSLIKIDHSENQTIVGDNYHAQRDSEKELLSGIIIEFDLAVKRFSQLHGKEASSMLSCSHAKRTPVPVAKDQAFARTRAIQEGFLIYTASEDNLSGDGSYENGSVPYRNGTDTLGM